MSQPSRITGGAPPAGRYDAIVVGSGFGGSVAALRLAEKGHRVAVLEQGRRVSRDEHAAAAQDPFRLVWMPALRRFGHMALHLFRDLAVLGGVGVGGGSLVYGAVLLEPEAALFGRPEWTRTGRDWARELEGPYATAARMLGRTTTPRLGLMDDELRRAAAALGAEHTFGPTPVGIYFGRPGETAPDPYFGGRGPARTGCRLCGECLAGCAHGAKNTLDQGYLYLAERLGATVVPETRAERLEPLPGGGYRVHTVDPRSRARRATFVADEVYLAAGVVGTVDLLLRSRDEHGTLPHLSRALGRHVRTNSEAIVGVEHDDAPPGLTHGAAISSHFFVGHDTHITQNRIAPAMGVLRLAATPMIDDDQPGRRARRTLAAMAQAPGETARRVTATAWHERVTLLTVMQHLDSELELRLARHPLAPWRRRLDTHVSREARPPTYLPVANAAARALAAACGGRPFSLVAESVGARSITAHILGGCAIGASAEHGVVDADHQVFGHPGLYVVDGAALPVNVGVNPSLTITALAERALAARPARPQRKAA